MAKPELTSPPMDVALRAACADRVADLLLRGVQRLPRSEGPCVQAQETTCRQCLVCEPFGGRFAADPVAQTPGPLLVVLDFPETGVDGLSDLANPESANHLIERLLHRAGLRDQSAFSFALRAPPRGAPLAEQVSTCATAWLVGDLAARQPQVILCFGARAELAVRCALPSCRGLSPRVLVLPSPQELKAYPHWRQSVWTQVTGACASLR